MSVDIRNITAEVDLSDESVYIVKITVFRNGEVWYRHGTGQPSQNLADVADGVDHQEQQIITNLIVAMQAALK